MTDQPVQPEATTKAGQAMEAWLREPENYEWGRKVTNAILAIEAEARAASEPPMSPQPQERPQPIHFKHDDWWCECGSRVEDCDYLQENLRAQERPQVITGYVNPDGSGEGNWDE
jgi:hypothetical protein